VLAFFLYRFTWFSGEDVKNLAYSIALLTFFSTSVLLLEGCGRDDQNNSLTSPANPNDFSELKTNPKTAPFKVKITGKLTWSNGKKITKGTVSITGAAVRAKVNAQGSYVLNFSAKSDNTYQVCAAVSGAQSQCLPVTLKRGQSNKTANFVFPTPITLPVTPVPPDPEPPVATDRVNLTLIGKVSYGDSNDGVGTTVINIQSGNVICIDSENANYLTFVVNCAIPANTRTTVCGDNGSTRPQCISFDSSSVDFTSYLYLGF